MEPSSVLIALEEREKWRSRKAQIEERLRDLRRRRDLLREELERVRRELSAIEDALFEPGERAIDVYSLPPFQMGR